MSSKDNFTFPEDDDDNFKYEEVVDEPDFDEEEDDLLNAFTSLNANNKNFDTGSQILSTSLTQVRPSVVDDFVRNFLIKAGIQTFSNAVNSGKR